MLIISYLSVMDKDLKSVFYREPRKPLRLITSFQPSTPAFEKHLGRTFKVTVDRPPHLARKSGGFRSRPPSGIGTQSTLNHEPVKLDSFLTGEHDVVQQGQFAVTIPIHKLKTIEKSVNDYLNSYTLDDLNSMFDTFAYMALVCFSCFAQELLQLNRDAFFMVVPMIFVCSLRLALKPKKSNLTATYIDEVLKEHGVPLGTRQALNHGLAFYTLVMLVPVIKITSSLKLQADYGSKLDVSSLLFLGGVIISLSISLVQKALLSFTICDIALVGCVSPHLSAYDIRSSEYED